MANKNLFTSLVGKLIPPTDAINEEQAPAYAFSAKHKVAQYAATGCLNSTFYASGKDQFDQVMALCAVVEPEFIAKTAVYCREKGFMKDMPALLCAALSTRDFALLAAIFHRKAAPLLSHPRCWVPHLNTYRHRRRHLFLPESPRIVPPRSDSVKWLT